ncbi:hypothetical protein ACFPAF_07490 [Hymenobacter endophyticus]|uniref:DUF3108 domain-containing protein n=1 Tax=Hymenobacter endophyticus TaxID=3076335 RepID=A0ABU3TFT8_9BACT|nr:hypothetical protein [Hymenobacter endophyticus]MDU0370228.1 hypothetical protein [Hymenobacter endophyticus]
MTRLLAVLAALLPAAVAAQTPASPPADCPHPFGLQDNMERVYQLQDAAGKPSGTIRQRVVSLGTEQNKKKTLTTNTVLLKHGVYDVKNRLQHQQDYTIRCRQDTTFIDGMVLLDPTALRSFRDRLFAFTPVPIAWPNQPAVGSSLPGGGVTVQVSSTAVSIATVSALAQNRKITGTETVTTPAGTFQCYKVEGEQSSSTVARADLVMRNAVRTVEYYSPEVGIVKAERYDKKGKLAEVQLLTSTGSGSAAEGRSETKQKIKVKKS